MTNYIEEMMNTAGVDLMHLDCEKCGAQRFALGQCAETNCQSIHPDFTAEKQIEIIKLLNDTRDFHCVNNALSALTEDGDEIEVHGKDFTQALAQLTTELMNAGELDKQKVKEILEL